MQTIRCPKCASRYYSKERRVDGQTLCLNCDYSSTDHNEWVAGNPPEQERKSRRMILSKTTDSEIFLRLQSIVDLLEHSTEITRGQSIARTKIEEAIMWLAKG